MSLIAAVSLLLRIAAAGWLLRVWHRARDGRLLAVFGMLAAMAIHQAVVPITAPVEEGGWASTAAAGWMALAISLLAIFAVAAIARLVDDRHTSSAPLAPAPRRLLVTASILGAVTIVASIANGMFAYRRGKALTMQTIAQSNLTLARTIWRNAAAQLGTDDDLASLRTRALPLIEEHWKRTGPKETGAYLCVIQAPGVLAAHSRRPELKGRHVASVPLPPVVPDDPATVGELLERGVDWSGVNVSATGIEQIIGYAYAPPIDALVVVHRPTRSAEREIQAAAVPWAISGVLITVLLIPFPLWLLQRGVVSAHRSLRASANHLQLLASVSPSIVFRADAGGRTVYVNDRWQTVTGLPAGTWADDGWIDAVHSDDRDRVARSWSKAVETQVTWREQCRVRRADGGTGWVLAHAVPVLLDDQRFDGFIGTCTDISELKRAEHALRESGTRLRQITDNIREVFWLMDWPSGKLLYVSRAFEEIWGRSIQSLYDEPDSWYDIVHEEDRDRVERRFGHDPARGAPDMEYRIVRSDGETRWIHDRAVPIFDERGEVHRLAGIAEDITARKRYEQELRRKSESERRLLSELDHRVRNNLSSLLSLVDLTQAGATDVAAFADAIRGRVQTMATVHTALSSARGRSSRLTELIESLTPPGAPGRVMVHGDAHIPARAAGSLAMVLHELMTNALKHGALGSANGLVGIWWDAAESPGERGRLRWREINGPPVEPDPTPGLGTTLVEGLVRADLQGAADLRFPSGGVDHRIEIHLTPASAEDSAVTTRSPSPPAVVPSEAV